ncbi:hypothetical protein LEP1GSC170_2444 [Leptospira interrogans serovar Bataviae str. HAI135]|nr:hypothetical protein LEP1GSC170_2444 [Leptospira interrogans serovar Bataviae str. HAI135]
MMRYAFLLTLILFFSPLGAQKSPFILEDKDSSSYPSVQFFIRDKNNFLWKEKVF